MTFLRRLYRQWLPHPASGAGVPDPTDKSREAMTQETTPELLPPSRCVECHETTFAFVADTVGVFRCVGCKKLHAGVTRPTPASEVTEAMVEAAIDEVRDKFLSWEPTDSQVGFAKACVKAALMQSSSEQPPCSDRACLHGTGSEGAIPSTATDADAVKEIVSELARYYYLNDLQGRADDASIEVPVRLLRLAAFKETTDEQG